MITIGYSTRNPNPKFQEVIKKSIGVKEYYIIEKINNGEKSLTEVYNEILEESKTDIVVLCHDDIMFDTEKWGKKVLNHFLNSDFGIIGLAGTTSLPESGRWWEDPSKMVGIVNHKHEGKKWESKYCKNWQEEVIETILVDGLFICLSKSKIKTNFDTNIPDFHFYDIDFSFQNHISGVKVGVMFDIRVTHLSIGMTNEKWESNRELFVKKFDGKLPHIFKPEIKIPKLPHHHFDGRTNIIVQSQGDIENFERLYNNIKSFNINNLIVNVIINEDKIKSLESVKYDDVKLISGYFDSLPQNLSILKWDANFIEDTDLIYFMDENVTILNDIFSSFSKFYIKNKKNFGGGFPICLNQDDTILSTKLDVIQDKGRIIFNLKNYNSFYNLSQGIFRHQLGNISPVFVTTKASLMENDWFKMNFSTDMMYNDFAIRQMKFNKDCIIDTNCVVKISEIKKLEEFTKDYSNIYNTLMENKKYETLIKR